jgi:hypothetical protein
MSCLRYPDLKFVATTTTWWDKVEPWCLEHLGPYGDVWYKEYTDIALEILGDPIIWTYWFQTEQQALLFRLRWG